MIEAVLFRRLTVTSLCMHALCAQRDGVNAALLLRLLLRLLRLLPCSTLGHTKLPGTHALPTDLTIFTLASRPDTASRQDMTGFVDEAPCCISKHVPGARPAVSTRLTLVDGYMSS